MSNPAPMLPPRLAFTYRDGEVARFHQLAAQIVGRILPWYSLLVVYGAMMFVIGFAVLGAQRSGFIGFDAVPPVLFTAYAAFYGSAMLLSLLAGRRNRRLALAALHTEGDVAMEVALSESTLAWKTDLVNGEISWRAVDAIEARRGYVLIRFLRVRFLFIPARAFADEMAQAAFIAAVRSRIGRDKALSKP